MIKYDTDGVNFLWNIGRYHGSVFPKAFIASFPSMVVSALFVHFLDYDQSDDPPLEHFHPSKGHILTNNAVWGGFSFLIGFLVVFRTSQAYSRFWEGATETHKMGAEWFDACSSLMAFCKHSENPREEILDFQNVLIRLFSMLHAAALGDIESAGEAYNTDYVDHYESMQAFRME